MRQVLLSRLGDSLMDDLTAQFGKLTPDSWLLLLPSSRLLHDMRHQLIQDTSPALNLLTFDELVDQVMAEKHRNRGALGGQLREELFAWHFRSLSPQLKALGARTSRAFSLELLDIVTQLGRAGLQPSALTTEGTLAPVLEDIAGLYQGYHRWQDELGLADVERKYQLAEKNFGVLPWLKDLKEVHIAWFFDFEEIQLRVIRELAELVPSITVHLPFAHQEPYPLVERTVDFLQGMGFTVAEKPGWTADLPPGLAHVNRNLFVPGAGRLAAPEVKSLAAPRTVQELELVAREIKTLVREGASPDSIALVIPDQERYADLDRLFRQWQIDISLPWITDLSEIPWVRELLALWAAASGESSAVLNSLKGVYINHYLPQDNHGDASLWLARSLGEPGHIHAWPEALEGQLEWLRDRLNSDLDYMTRKSLEERAALTERGRPGLQCLLGLLAGIGGEKTSVGHCHLLQELVQANLERICPPGMDEMALRDRLAFKTFNQIITSFLKSLELCGDESLSPEDFLAKFRPWLTGAVALERINPRAIQVLAPSQCRGMKFKHVFILGLNQNVFPRAISRHWLWDRPGLGDLAAQMGLGSRDTLVREKIFFHCCIAMAQENLWLVRQVPGVNEEAEASVFQLETEALLTDHQTTSMTPADILPGPGQALAKSALTQRTIYQAVWGEHPPHQALTWLSGAPDYPEFYRRSQAGAERFSSTPPGIWDGVLSADGRAVEIVQKRFASKIWSISRLEAYIRCPFAFFARYVLGGQPEPGGANQFDALERGTWGHWVMEKFWARNSLGAFAEGEVLTLLLDLAMEWVTESGRDSSQRIWQERSHDLARRLQKLVINDLDWFKRTGFKPGYFELEFGSDKQLGPVFPGQGQVGFRGKIDRIDIRETEQGRQAVVLDYKTSRAVTMGDIYKNRSSLQIPVYIAAANQLKTLEAEAVGGGYLVIKSGKREGGIWLKELAGDLPGVNWQNTITQEQYQIFEQELAEDLVNLHQRICQGSFPPAPAKVQFCQWCDFRGICRYDQFRFADKGGTVDEISDC